MSISLETEPSESNAPVTAHVVPVQPSGSTLETVPPAVAPRPVSEDDVFHYVRREPLRADDVRLLAHLAGIARLDPSAVMRSMGLAARNPDEIRITLERQSLLPTTDQLPRTVIDALQAALQVREGQLESRLEPTALARVTLLNFPRYTDLISENNQAHRTHYAGYTDRLQPLRKVKYYALGRIAAMIAAHDSTTAAVQ